MSRHSAAPVSAGEEVIERLLWVVDAGYRTWHWVWATSDRDWSPPFAVTALVRFGVLQGLFFVALAAT